jgi:hypothetical protein
MNKAFSPEEVAIVIRSRRILKEKGLAADTDVSGICKAADVSRKTGYQWEQKHFGRQEDRQKGLEADVAKLQADCDRLKKEKQWLDVENRGRKLAWEIHSVDELLAEKKSTTAPKKKKRQ